MSMFSKGFKFALVASAIAALLACGGGSSSPAQVVATSDVAVSVTPTNGPGITAALPGNTFTFPAGAAGLGTAAPVALKLIASTPTATFEAKTGVDTVTGDLAYGSCIFTVRATTNPSLFGPVGSVNIFNICRFTINLAGALADGVAFPRLISLDLNNARGIATVPVTVNPNGSVLVNGGTFGSTVLVVVTTGAGG